MTATHSLDRLLPQSQQLNAKTAGSRNIPTIYRGIEQIEAYSTKLAAKVGIFSPESNTSRSSELRQSALARIGFVPVGLERGGNALSTDVAGYLQAEYEKKIVSCIEHIQQETSKKVNSLINAKLAGEWERRKKLLIEDGFERVSAQTKSPASALATPKSRAYLAAVRKLNECRLRGEKPPACRVFQTELRGHDSDAKSEQIAACWDCLATITREDEMDNVFQDRDLAALYHAAPDTANRASWHKMLIAGSRKYLETSYGRFVDTTIAVYPRDAQLGGRPSNADRIRAFLNVRMKRSAPADQQRLEYVDGTPIWACIFYLFRCGYLRDAYQCACQHELHLLKSEPGMIAYLKAFLETEDHCLTGTVRAQVQSDYSQRLLVGNQDPYKMALFKILGRCDLSKKTLPDVIQTTQDYVWLQLWLVRDGQTAGDGPRETAYTLPALQRAVLDLGASHFNPKGNNPVQYCETLLTVGLFEDAIGHLYDSPSHQPDAIHFAIALAHHGTLNIVADPDGADWDTVQSLRPGAAHSAVNYLKLVSTASRAFSPTDAIDALQYQLLLPLAASAKYDALCQKGIRDVILSAGSFSTLLGDVTADGIFRPGLVSKFAPLMRLGDERAFVQSITRSAAAKCEQDDQYRDAIHLYNLAGEYDRVLHILTRKMAQVFSQAHVPDTLLNLYSISLSVHQFYAQNQLIVARLDRRALDTCRTLLGLLEFKRFAAEAHWQQALHKMDELALLPSDGDISAVSAVAERFKTLHDAVTTNLSDMLLHTMTCIYQLFLEAREHASTDVGRQQQIQRLRRKSRSLMIFVGMMQHRVSQDVCAKLTRMDIFMN